MARFKTSGEFEVEFVRYVWKVRHYAGASTPYENLRGVSASVAIQGKNTKELIVDFPLEDYFFTKPKSTAVFERRLQRCVVGALELGWEPESRGKPYRVRSGDVEGVASK